MSDNQFKYYLQDLVVLLIEDALKAKKTSKAAKQAKSKDYDFELGYLMAMHHVITLMQQQAEAFQIPLSEMGLDKINPDHELL